MRCRLYGGGASLEIDMPSLDIATSSLLSPMTLCFLLGVLSVALRSDLAVPEPLSRFLAIYLMLAIGLKGGAELNSGSAVSIPLLLAGTGIALVVPLWIFAAARRIAGFSVPDAASLAAHYGSVSAVTFIAALAYLNLVGIAPEPGATALLAVMEVPAILVAIALARLAGGSAGSLWPVLATILSRKSIVLLIGGLAIGAVSGPTGLAPVRPLFDDLFRGLLCLFLLDLGIQVARGASGIRSAALALVGFGLVAPLANAGLGLVVAKLIGLSVGGSVVLATLAASASYIVAPAAIRSALPEADGTPALAAALAVTFPFNLIVGLPLYTALARLLQG